MKLSVAIIAKNEEAMIRNCLESVKDADEIMFLDTGSTDNTVAIANEYTGFVFQEDWKDDFAKMFNLACSACSGDWILSIDADEQLEDDGIWKIRKFLKNSFERAYRLHLEYSDKTSIGIKLLRNRAGTYWVGKAHVDLNVPVKATLPVKIYCGNSPAHKNDPDRTLRILKRDFYDTPSNTRNLYYLAREYATRHNFEDALDLFKRYFEEGDDKFLVADASLYLAKLCRVTGDMKSARDWANNATCILPEFKEAWDFRTLIAQDKFDRFTFRKKCAEATNVGVRIIRKHKWADLND